MFEDFDIQEFLENTISGTLADAITKALIYAMIAGVLVFIAVWAVKGAISGISTKAREYAQRIAAKEESREKLAEWARRSDLLSAKQKQAFKNIAKEKFEAESRLRAMAPSISVGSKFQEKIVRSTETYHVLKDKAVPSGASEESTKVANFIIGSLFANGGKEVILEVDKPHGRMPALTDEQFSIMVEHLIDSDAFIEYMESGSARSKKSLLGHTVEISVGSDPRTLRAKWQPKTREVTERVPVDQDEVDPYAEFGYLSMDSVAETIATDSEDPYAGLINSLGNGDGYEGLITAI